MLRVPALGEYALESADEALSACLVPAHDRAETLTRVWWGFDAHYLHGLSETQLEQAV